VATRSALIDCPEVHWLGWTALSDAELRAQYEQLNAELGEQAQESAVKPGHAMVDEPAASEEQPVEAEPSAHTTVVEQEPKQEHTQMPSLPPSQTDCGLDNMP
jgi:hypothetical protein